MRSCDLILILWLMSMTAIRLLVLKKHSRTLSGTVIDTVVMNPPFGTRCKGVDMDFLSVALKVRDFRFC